MDDQRRKRPDDDQQAAPAEGVRIIGPDEAAEVMERDDVAPRRGGDQPRFGDRPAPPPEGPRPALRFPLDASADPTRIERPPVQPAPDPVTGPVELPHWTEPPTGEVPAVLIGDDRPLLDDDGDDLDAWSSFATSTPRWRDADDDWGDDGFMEKLASESDEVRVGAMGDSASEPSHDEYFGFDDLEERVGERTRDAADQPRFDAGGDDWNAADAGEVEQSPAVTDAWPGDDQAGAEDWDDVAPLGREAGGRGVDAPDDRYDDDVEGRYVADDRGPNDNDTHDNEISDDEISDDQAKDGSVYDQPYDDATDADDEGVAYEPDGYDDDHVEAAPPPAQGERDVGQAAMVGVGLAILGIALLLLGAKFMVPFVALILGVAATEYFGKLRDVGWEAATLLGIGATVAFPFAVYWRGPSAAALVGFVTVVAVFAWYLVGAGGSEPRVLEGSGATLFGVFWIGGLGSAAAAMLQVPDGRWLFVTAILATVAYDAGGFFIGRALGHRPLSAASPNKTWEGLVGGMGSAMVATLLVVGFLQEGPWTGLSAFLILGLGAAVAAPLGDLCQSLLKRDLGVKDMSSILPGHGGVLDRFDGMLFVLPTVFWLYIAFAPMAG